MPVKELGSMCMGMDQGDPKDASDGKDAADDEEGKVGIADTRPARRSRRHVRLTRSGAVADV